MAKNKPKINFRGKEMSIPKARLYLLGLELRVLNAYLSENEEIEYLKWKNFRENRNELSKKLTGDYIFKGIDENKYLIEELGKKIYAAKILEKMEYCKKHGHKEEKGSAYTPPGIEKTITYVHCKRCGTLYERGASSYKEYIPIQPIKNVFRGN
jgi:hypothetical protein